MTDRDILACAALTGLLAGPTMINGGAVGIAETAYRIADAAMAERALPPFSRRPPAQSETTAETVLP